MTENSQDIKVLSKQVVFLGTRTNGSRIEMLRRGWGCRAVGRVSQTYTGDFGQEWREHGKQERTGTWQAGWVRATWEISMSHSVCRHMEVQYLALSVWRPRLLKGLTAGVVNSLSELTLSWGGRNRTWRLRKAMGLALGLGNRFVWVVMVTGRDQVWVKDIRRQHPGLFLRVITSPIR